MNEEEKGNRGVELAIRWWPSLKPTARFSKDDCDGIDAWLGSEGVQIKYDQRSNMTGNIVHEIYEKPPGEPGAKWRGVGKRATCYIFVNEEWALMVRTDALAAYETGMTLKSINNGGTALGFIIPTVKLFGTEGWEAHYHGPTHGKTKEG